MSGFGSMSSMNSSLKNNKNLRNSKKSFRDQKDDLMGHSHGNDAPLVYENKMSVEQLIAFKQRLKTKKRNSNIILGIVFTSILILVLVVIWKI